MRASQFHTEEIMALFLPIDKAVGDPVGVRMETHSMDNILDTSDLLERAALTYEYHAGGNTLRRIGLYIALHYGELKEVSDEYRDAV